MARILIVEDTAPIRWLLHRVLEEDGHTVVEAADGEEGWRLWQMSTPDLTITDIGMPGISGLELIRMIRTHRPDSKILVLSAQLDAAQATMLVDPISFLPKPFELLELRRQVPRCA